MNSEMFFLYYRIRPNNRTYSYPVPEMSAKKVIFRMENWGHLPAEVCGVLGRFVRKSTQAGNFVCANVRNISICRSAVVRREVRGSLRTSMRTSVDIFAAWIGADVHMDGCRCMRKSTWMGVDIRRARGSVRVAPPAV